MNIQALKSRIGFIFGSTWIKTKLEYLSIILPLLLTLLIQRGEHLIDNRFISALGSEPLKIHSIFYIFLLIGQSVGIASSSSLLTLWKRQENLNKQYDIAKKHFYLTLIISFIFAVLIKWNLNLIIHHFQISTSYSDIAETYLNIGIINIIIQSFLGLSLTLLVASNLMRLSFILMTFLFGIKFLVGFFATHILWDQNQNAISLFRPMLTIGSLGVLFVLILVITSILSAIRKISKDEEVEYLTIFEIWNAEVLVSFIRALAPTIFSFQLAIFNKHESLFVIYQMALQAAYLIVLPISAANQIAVRDASNEQSLMKSYDKIIKLKNAVWFKNYFYCILLPNLILVAICGLYPFGFFNLIFNYQLDFEQSQFVSLYFFAVLIGQVGNLMLVRLRSVKLNRIISVNTFIAEILVQLGLLQLLIIFKLNDIRLLGLVVIFYCGTHLGLNSLSVLRHLEKRVKI